MSTVQVSFGRTMEPSADHGGHSGDLLYTTKPLASSGWLLVPRSEGYLIIPASMLRSAGTNRVRLHRRVPWPSYRALFDRTHPHARRVKTEYRRRMRSRGRKR